MKTERLVLLVTPEEKARIAGGATKLGVSASEYVRQLVNGFGPEDLAMLPELDLLWPEVDAAIEQMNTSLDRAIATLEEGEERRRYLTSDGYREEIRQQLLASGIDWAAARRRFGGGADREAA